MVQRKTFDLHVDMLAKKHRCQENDEYDNPFFRRGFLLTRTFVFARSQIRAPLSLGSKADRDPHRRKF